MVEGIQNDIDKTHQPNLKKLPGNKNQYVIIC